MDSIILLIEDNDDDVLIINRAIKKNEIVNPVHHVSNGLKALDFFRDNPNIRVELILLDLNMEVMNGFEFLEKRQEIQQIRLIPTIVLTTSNRQEDIKRCYELGANAYVEKPVDPGEFIDAFLKIDAFWIKLAKKHN